MKIIDDIIATLQEDCPVQEVRACALWTAVVSKNCGLASTLRSIGPHHTRNPVPEAGVLRRKTARELTTYANSDSLLLASIGMACINSLVETDLDRCMERNAFDILKEHGNGKKIAVVGHFPFIPKLKEIASELWVLEQHPAEGDLPEEEAKTVLPQADVIAITGTSLINHTFEKLINLCQESFVIVLGPSTPLSPVFFDHGVNVVSGVKVTEPETVLRYISEGASFRQIKGGVRLLTMVS